MTRMTRPVGSRGGAIDGNASVETRITRESLDDPSWVAALGSHADGAVLVFQGRVRGSNEGRAVSRLEYEAYEQMAQRELRAICGEAAARFAVGAVRAAHRVGELALGEVSVAIGVAAAHRDACYDASRWIIEEVKVRLPIWKHEHYVDGGSSWVGGPDLPDGSETPPSPARRKARVRAGGEERT